MRAERSSVRRRDQRVSLVYQVNEVAEVLLYLLRGQTPHQVQGTVQLLIILGDASKEKE